MERVLIAGGGTGGHLYPGLAVAEVIKSKHRGTEIRFAGTERGLEAKVVPKAGYPLEMLSVRGMPRGLGFGYLPWGIAFIKSLFECRRLFNEWRPDVILGTGGYASAPPVLVGRMMGIPVVLQEQNSVPGIVTRKLSGYANEVHLNFPGARRFLARRDHLKLTGNPLRPGIIEGNRRRALKNFGLEEKRRTVLIIGGSHGASTLNRALIEAAPELATDRPVQFLVQTGAKDHDEVEKALAGTRFPASVNAFLTDMNDAYALADVVVCRAGAMTLSEIAACGLPSVLVPYPHATDDHQTQNAQEIVDRGAAVMVADSELDGARLAKELHRLLGNPNRLRRMASLARGSARYGGADRLADAIVAYGAQPDFVVGEEPEEEVSGPIKDIRQEIRAAAERKATRKRGAPRRDGRGAKKRAGGESRNASADAKSGGRGRGRRGRGGANRAAGGTAIRDRGAR
jgi:UDP-N-acetylglucosamine--N-acetylmuramyl-(pentapeptide) pyrophosphoryl-undecaprenol N-acetylglucosamine transferase